MFHLEYININIIKAKKLTTFMNRHWNKIMSLPTFDNIYLWAYV